jgi:hypothetical protein
VAERALGLAGEEGTVASLAEARRLLDRAESRVEAIGYPA